MNRIIDLRSDTVTMPTDEMRKAISDAKLGDDVFSEDPTVNQLEALAAKIMGKEAGLLVPSVTMGNLVSILSHCPRGTEILLGDKSHTFYYEAGGISAFGGIHSRQLKNQELFKNFKELRSNTLQKIKDHSGFDILPRTKTNEKNSELGNFANESLIVKEIDYYFSNSIARSSKTMSDCRSARSNNLKSKTGS